MEKKDQVVDLKLEEQVTSLEPSKELKKLGVKQGSLWYWTWVEWNGKTEWVLIPWDRAIKLNKETYSAFTDAELGEILDSDTVSGRIVIDEENAKKYCCFHLSIPEFEVWDERTQFADKEADARAKMVIYLIKEGIIEVKKDACFKRKTYRRNKETTREI